MRTRFALGRQRLVTVAALGALLGAPFVTPIPAGADGLCGSWSITPTPDVGNSVTRLTSVTALTASDAWAVGYWRNDPAGTGAVAIRWDGSAWSLTGLPDTDHLGTQPQTLGVDHAPNGDIWVVGYLTTSYPTHNLPLVLRHRDGAWDQVEAVTLRPQTEYPYAARGGFAYEVDVIATDDAWAVGTANGFGDAATASVPLALHWDGSTWTDVDVPIIANRHHELTDVVAIASDDVWAVGDYRFISGTFRGVTYHWDGHAWSHVESPIESISQSGLDDVAASGPDDVWALGGADGQSVLMHWDGSVWSLAQPPPHSVGGTLIARGPDDLWVSGWNGFWHWDGSSWTEVPSAVPGAAYVIRGGAMALAGGCDIWSVGFWTLADGITSFTLAERLQPDPAPVADAGAGGNHLGVSFTNPYRPGLPIRLGLPGADGSAILTVHDLRGRTVQHARLEAAGPSAWAEWAWDGRTESGARSPAGVYLIRVQSGGEVITRKLILP